MSDNICIKDTIAFDISPQIDSSILSIARNDGSPAIVIDLKSGDVQLHGLDVNDAAELFWQAIYSFTHPENQPTKIKDLKQQEIDTPLETGIVKTPNGSGVFIEQKDALWYGFNLNTLINTKIDAIGKALIQKLASLLSN